MTTGPGGAPGPLLARGREAEVFDIGAGRVLRRYLDPGRSTAREAGAMRHLARHGYPVPAVMHADGPDLVMERVEGPTMLDDLARRPWRLPRHARALAALHDHLHRLPVPDGLPERFGPGSAVLHLDLHPANVVLAPGGPAVIDWTNVGAGPAAADVAQTWVLLETSDVPVAGRRRRLLEAARGAFLRRLLARLDRDAAARLVPLVADARRQDPNVTATERRAIDRLVATLEGATG